MNFYQAPKREQREHILPLVNVVFLLLIFFMLAGKLTEQDAFTVIPPQSSSEAAAEPLDFTVSIAPDQRLAINGEQIELSMLAGHIGAEMENEDVSATQVRLKADAGADSQFVIQVMESLRETGIERLLLLTEREDG